MKIEQPQPIYNLLVAGANGGIGLMAVEQALQAGHKVTALVRNPAKLTLKHPNLTMVKGDVMKLGSFAHYVQGHDAVISALGAGGGFFNDKPTTLYSQGGANILQAMQQYGVSRAFFISASGLDAGPGLPFLVRFFARYVLQKLLRNMYNDLRVMEKIVKASNADWTIMRPPRLLDKPVTGKYRVAINEYLKGGMEIARADVAHYMLANLFTKAIYNTTVEVGY